MSVWDLVQKTKETPSLLFRTWAGASPPRDSTTALPDLGRAATPPLRDSAAALPDLCRAGPGSGPGPEVQWWSLSRSSLIQPEIVSQRARQTPENLGIILLVLFLTLLILFFEKKILFNTFTRVCVGAEPVLQ